MKTIKIKFLDGSFRIFNDIVEFAASKKFLFLALTNNGSSAKAFERVHIEEVYMKDSSGKYFALTLPRSYRK